MLFNRITGQNFSIKKWPGEYKVHRRHALEDKQGNPDTIDGRSIFPSKLSTRKLKQMMKVDYYNFMSQYQCVPRVGRDQSFDDQWFRFGYGRATGGLDLGSLATLNGSMTASGGNIRDLLLALTQSEAFLYRTNEE